MSKAISSRTLTHIFDAMRLDYRERYIRAGGTFGPSGRPVIDGRMKPGARLGTLAALAATLTIFDELPKHPRPEWLKLISIGWGMGHAGVALPTYEHQLAKAMKANAARLAKRPVVIAECLALLREGTKKTAIYAYADQRHGVKETTLRGWMKHVAEWHQPAPKKTSGNR